MDRRIIRSVNSETEAPSSLRSMHVLLRAPERSPNGEANGELKVGGIGGETDAEAEIDRPSRGVKIRHSKPQRALHQEGRRDDRVVQRRSAGEALIPSDRHRSFGVEREDGAELEADCIARPEVTGNHSRLTVRVSRLNGVGSVQIGRIGEITEEDDRVVGLGGGKVSLHSVEPGAEGSLAAVEIEAVDTGGGFEADIGQKIRHTAVLECELPRYAKGDVAKTEGALIGLSAVDIDGTVQLITIRNVGLELKLVGKSEASR